MSPPGGGAGHADRAVRLFWLTAFLVLQGLLLLSPEAVSVDREEGMVPLAARLMDWTTPGVWPELAYRPFCGGCQVGMLVANPVFYVLGDSVLVWKTLLLPFQLAWFLAAVGIGAAVGGRRGVTVAGALACFPPAVVALASWRGWLNHYEATAVALLGVALLTDPRPHTRRGLVATGLILGLGAFVSWTALPLVLSALLLGAGHLARSERLLVAVVSAWPVVPWELRRRAHLAPWDFGDVHGAPWMDVASLGAVVAPGRWASLFDLSTSAALLPGLALVGCAVLGARRAVGRTVLLGAVLTLAALVFGPFRLDAGETLGLLQSRYLVAPLMLLWVGAAVGLADLAARGRVGWVVLLAVLLVAPGLAFRARAAPAGLGTSHLLTVHAPAWDRIDLDGLRRGALGGAWACGDDAACLAVRAARDAAPPAGASCDAWRVPCDRLGTLTCSDGTEVGRLAACLREPRFGRPALDPSALHPSCRVAWATAAGDVWSRRFGTADPPEGWEAWEAPVREAFRTAVEEAWSRPWQVVTRLPSMQRPPACGGPVESP